MSYGDSGIEHPDHTGASANPLAPWNQPDAEDVIDCDVCGEEMPASRAADGICEECEAEGPTDEQIYRQADALGSIVPDTRDEHDPTL